MSRVALASIPALTFYKDSLTKAQRTSPIEQLTCIGKPCHLYTPEVVRCENIGGAGDEVDWKCEADLPESLRFGRVEVSCEGWSGPGDPYILKGSCGLQYRLIHVPNALRNDNFHERIPSWFSTMDTASLIFMTLWGGVLALMLYSLIKSCIRTSSSSSGGPSNPPRPNPPRPGSSGWFPGDHRDDGSYYPPPPYSKSTTPDSSQGSGWTPGFWTGAAAGGLGATLLNNRRQATQRQPSYDWERNRGGSLRSAASSEDRGEGSSSLGAMRSSTGLGGSNVR